MTKWFVLAVLAIVPLTGCIGAADYSCKGVPDGAMCLSVKDTYSITNSEDYKRLQTNENGKKEVPTQMTGAALQSQTITAPEQAVRSLDGSHAVPIRVPAQIMRVWYGPYEASNGYASFLPSVGYVEIAPRKWIFSKPNVKTGRKIQPLSVHTAYAQSNLPGHGDQATGLHDLKPELPTSKGNPTTKGE